MTRRAGLLELAMSGPAPSAQDVELVLAHHAAIWGDARMDDGDDDGEGGDGAAGAGTGTERTFTQRELEHRAAQEKSQGEREGHKKLLETLGLPADTKPEDIKAILDRQRAAEDAQKTEAQKAREAADAEKAQAAKDRETAAADRHQANLERYLLRAGVAAGETDDAKLAKAIDRASKLVDVEQGAEPDKIRDAVADLKKDMPALFTASSSGEQPHGDPAPQTRSAGDGKKSGVERGKAKAAELGWTKEKQTA